MHIKHQIWLSFSFVEPPLQMELSSLTIERYWPVPGHRNLGVSTLLSRGSADVAAPVLSSKSCLQ